MLSYNCIPSSLKNKKLPVVEAEVREQVRSTFTLEDLELLDELHANPGRGVGRARGRARGQPLAPGGLAAAPGGLAAAPGGQAAAPGPAHGGPPLPNVIIETSSQSSSQDEANSSSSDEEIVQVKIVFILKN